MGEIADMMLEGDLCEGCGMALDSEGYGIPRYCSNECARDRGFDGIQSDGAGTYKQSKTKHKSDSNFILNMTYNGNQLFDDRKKLKYADTSYDIAKEFANKVRKLADEHFAHPSKTNDGGTE